MMHLHQGRRERRGGSRLWWVYVGGCALALGAVLLALRVLAAVPAQSPPADGRTPQREATEQAILR